MVDCPICGKAVREANINSHIDSSCQTHLDIEGEGSQPAASSQVATFFQPVSAKIPDRLASQPSVSNGSYSTVISARTSDDHLKSDPPTALGSKRPVPDEKPDNTQLANGSLANGDNLAKPAAKRMKASNALQRAAPLAERMRPNKLDDVCGQELVGPDGVLRGLIETDRVPSMILWGGAGTGKTTIARVIANMVGSRFVEINSTSSGVGECKKIFAEAGNELRLSGRKTIIFCDEIHRFSKSQQDVFLGPVESGQVTLIGATTENPSFKVQNALLSRCRTFTLQKLKDGDITTILRRALVAEGPNYSPSALVDDELILYLSAFADGDARTALNLLELAMDVSKRHGATKGTIKSSLTKTLVYDRAGDQHCALETLLSLIFLNLTCQQMIPFRHSISQFGAPIPMPLFTILVVCLPRGKIHYTSRDVW